MTDDLDLVFSPPYSANYDPPLVLYVRGNAAALAQHGIAVIGTRHPTPYGIGMAERLACDLAARGLVIFSGLARGVDTAAHWGAVSAKGKTVAVFGTGARRLSKGEFAARRARSLGEFPLGTFAAPQNFPMRNRIISGMSFAVLVFEAAEYSDGHHRALRARARPRRLRSAGQCYKQKLLGPNTLIKQGATGRHVGRRLGGTAC